MATTRNQKIIDRIVGEVDSPEDHSLNSQALERALSGKTPTTLTPWEWEEWYAEHGRPEEHNNPTNRD